MPSEIKTKEEIAELERKKQKQAAKNKKQAAVKRAIDSAQKKEQDAALKPTVNTKPTANDWGLKNNIKNEQEIREFFKSIKSLILDGKDITDKMIDFFAKPTKRLYLANIIEKLPTDLYGELVLEHLNQIQSETPNDKSLDRFWEDDYKFRSHVKEAILTKSREDKTYTPITPITPIKQPEKKKKEEKEYPPWIAKVQGDEDGQQVVYYLTGKQVDPKATVVEVKKKPRPIPISFTIDPLENCFEQGKLSSVSDVTETYICPHGTQDEKKRLENILKQSEDPTKTKTITQQGVTWYLLDERVALRLCKTRRIWNDENETVTAIFTSGNLNKKSICFKVLYKTMTGIYFNQNRDRFLQEKANIDKIRKSTEKDTARILNSTITPDIKQLVRRLLSESLSNAADEEVENYKDKDSPYITKAVDEMVNTSGDSTETLFEKLANITLFLQNKNSVFAERVRDEFYIPEVLVSLSVEEKFPEVFGDRTIDKEKVNKYILKQTKAIVTDFVDLLYRTRFPNQHIDAQKSMITPGFTQKEWKSVCINNKEVESAKKSTVFYYPEGEHVYCLLIEDIYKQIRGDVPPLNKVTKKPIDPTFLKKFREIYDSKFLAEEIIVADTLIKKHAVVDKPPPPKRIAPWLLKTIIENIKECENELKNEDGKCGGSLDKESYDDDTADSLFGSEPESPGILDSPGIPESPESIESPGTDDSCESGHSPGSSCQPQDVIKGNICQYCKTKFTRKTKREYERTMIRDMNGQDQCVWFCSFECFEKYNCPKSKKGRKGGRHASQDRKVKRVEANVIKEKKKRK